MAEASEAKVELDSFTSTKEHQLDFVKIACLSDTHGHHERVQIPACDIVIHAGDFTAFGRKPKEFWEWVGTLPAAHFVMVLGNHENLLSKKDIAIGAAIKSPQVHILDHESVSIEGIEIHGIRWQPDYSPDNDYAFPSTTNILITHNPPRGILDKEVGDVSLAKAISERSDALKMHVFGHIHEARGEELVGSTLFINAAVVDRRRVPVMGARLCEVPRSKTGTATVKTVTEILEAKLPAAVNTHH